MNGTWMYLGMCMHHRVRSECSMCKYVSLNDLNVPEVCQPCINAHNIYKVETNADMFAFFHLKSWIQNSATLHSLFIFKNIHLKSEWVCCAHNEAIKFDIGLKIDPKLSRGEICVANFIPPANGASLGIHFKAKNLKFKAERFLKTGWQKQPWQPIKLQGSLLAWHSKCAVDSNILKYF